VETVRRGLQPVLEGRVLAEVIQRRPDLRWPLPERFGARLQGRRVERLGRRSKYLLAHLDGGETWITHLGMSGRLLIDGTETVELHHERAAPGKHDHVIVTTDHGVRVTYNDARRFGAMDLWETESLDDHPLLARLGPEPNGNAFSGAYLAEALKGKQTPIKSALLDQRIIAGLGNIYVCEALFRAGIHPTRMAGSISRPRIDRLAGEIVETIGDAIAAGGSSLRDYRQADGELGYFQHSFRVYDREDSACTREGCPGVIRRIAQAGRSTFYCPRCQR
ncbi:MAG: bifunctional DNA-formamidopyrimidine glycosylase/DNA-(apurinic or apyrimidinic site) lyase, partial [Pseudomonadota bacterium]